jgi:hypothetical protein
VSVGIGSDTTTPTAASLPTFCRLIVYSISSPPSRLPPLTSATVFVVLSEGWMTSTAKVRTCGKNWSRVVVNVRVADVAPFGRMPSASTTPMS